MLRRLTSVQLRNTLIAAFQDPAVPEGDVLVDPVIHGFQIDATAAVVRDLDAQKIMGYAERVADWAATQKLNQLAACDTATTACREEFVATLGARLYREPLPEASRAAYLAMLDAEPSFADGARVVIAAMLQSPFVLYRRELGVADPDRPGEVRLTPHELASNLAYFLTDGPPDDALRQAAEQGRLVTPDDLAREAARLLQTPASAAVMGRFVRGWLETDDLLTRAKSDPTNQLTDDVRRQMLAETDALFVDVLLRGAPIAELLSATYTFVDGPLGGYYGIGGGGGQRVELQPGTRAPGLLGHGSVLTRHALADASSPTQRGKLVRERLLCETIAPPPPNVDANLGDPGAAQTTRERYEIHAAGSCAGCHDALDPIGFAFEGFDGFGKKRDQENGVPIDASGALTGLGGGDVPLDGLASLADALAGQPEVDACLSHYVAYYAYGLEGCHPEAIEEGLAAAGGTLQGLVMAVVRAPQFSRRAEP